MISAPPPLSSRLSVAPASGKPTLTPQQKKFNTLVRKIEAQRQLLADWQLAIPLYAQKRAAELTPLYADYAALNLQLVNFLDQSFGQKGLSRTDRDTISQTICMLAPTLLDGPEREAMKALYNKHGHGAFEDREQEAMDAVRALVQQEFGVDLGDDLDMNSPEAVMQRLAELRDAQAQAEAHSDGARADAAQAAAAAHAARSRQRKPSARQAKHEAEQQQVSQSLREVYRKLASALHPDRETDPDEVTRKTALMKRVNQAYANKNLLDLLTLQLEIEQIDPQAMLALGDDRLKRYNQILSEQLAELQQETEHTADNFKMELGLTPCAPLAPVGLLRELKLQLRELQDDIDMMKDQLRSLVDLKTFRRWLKQQRTEGDLFDGSPDDLFSLRR